MIYAYEIIGIQHNTNQIFRVIGRSDATYAIKYEVTLGAMLFAWLFFCHMSCRLVS